MAKIKNNFNDLGPKEWLPFQKSFTLFETMESLIQSNLKFFIKPSLSPAPNVLSFGQDDFQSMFQKTAQNLNVNSTKTSFDFLALDLTNPIHLQAGIDWAIENGKNLNYRKFMWILVPTDLMSKNNSPIAWELSNQFAGFLTRKDEKIICHPDGHTWTSLYFRKDEHSLFQNYPSIESTHQASTQSTHHLQNWFILKPKPRSKDQILHPAKYPEELVRMYLEEFTKKGDTVFDPMSGTGTTQVEALNLGRHAFGIELSELFHGIANKRCAEISTQNHYSIFLGDSRNILNFEIPELDYIITSPPYWDMLNMKGAEVQANRKSKGLQTNYSDNKNDLGNLDDYTKFLNVLTEIYQNTTQKLKSGGHLTIVVKNIKKKGEHFPLAFDLTNRLISFLEFKHVAFWCQDDLQIAPYGYKHTFVSNTFHHYCITFQKT
jgi:DNA modification methylase